MPLKDHYRTLEILPNASTEEVKKAFRKLAHQYHPDKNADNPYAAARFMEAQQAYATLSDERLRRLYDEERFFAGMAAQKEPQLLNAQWLVQQAAKLSKHMQQVDSDRMNHQALAGYIRLLLSDAHLAVLLAEKDGTVRIEWVDHILDSIRKLQYPLLMGIIDKLKIVAGEDSRTIADINKLVRIRRNEHRMEKAMPFIVVGIAVVLCAVMFLLVRR